MINKLIKNERRWGLTRWRWRWRWARLCRNLSDSRSSSSVSGASPLRSSHSIGTHRNTCLWWGWAPQTGYRWSHIWGILLRSRSTAGGQDSDNHHSASQCQWWHCSVYYVRFQHLKFKFTCSSRTTFSGWFPTARAHQSMQEKHPDTHTHTKP